MLHPPGESRELFSWGASTHSHYFFVSVIASLCGTTVFASSSPFSASPIYPSYLRSALSLVFSNSGWYCLQVHELPSRLSLPFNLRAEFISTVTQRHCSYVRNKFGLIFLNGTGIDIVSSVPAVLIIRLINGWHRCSAGHPRISKGL